MNFVTCIAKSGEARLHAAILANLLRGEFWARLPLMWLT